MSNEKNSIENAISYARTASLNLGLCLSRIRGINDLNNLCSKIEELKEDLSCDIEELESVKKGIENAR